MTQNREIEAKTILSKTVYQNIVKAFPVKADFKQENYYFDTTKSLLKHHKIALRIRIFKDHAEQTLKVPDLRPVQSKFHEVIEINDKLELQQAKSLVKQASNDEEITFTGTVGAYLSKNFSTQKYHLLTWSKTERILLNGPENCELTLDATSYPDRFEDYELEIENTDPALIKKVLLMLEKEYNFKQTNSNTNQSKIGRAFAHQG